MLKRLLVGAAGLAVLTGSMLMGLSSASASVSPTTVYTTNGEAGYYAFGADAGFARVHSQVYIRKYAANLPATGAMGAQACNNNVNYAVQVGLVPNGTTPQTFSVRYAQGAFTTTTTDPCVGNGTLGLGSPLSTTALQNIPLQDNIAFNIKDLPGHRVVVSAQDLTTNTTDWSQVLTVPVSYWTEVGVGLQGSVTGLGGPATNELAAMRNSYVVDNAGHFGNLGNSPYWTGVQVNSSATGNAPALITPASSLNGSYFKIWSATPVS